MNKNISYWFFAIIGLSYWTVSCSGPAMPPPPSAVPVNLDTVELQTSVYFDQYPGNVIALNEVELRSEVNGFITDIAFEEGKYVQKGQKLYVIEQSKYQAAYAQAEANVKIAKANLEKAKNDAGRYTRLGEQGMASKQRMEYAETDVDNATSQVAAAEASLLRASIDLNHATIKAPFEGTIGISLVKKGAYVTAGQTLLNTLSSDNPIAVDFVISEKEISRFLQLKDLKSAKTDSVFTIQLADKSTYAIPGQIAFLDRAVDPRTATLKVRLMFSNPKHALRAGMSCNVRVRNKTPQAQAVIPYKAVTEQMGEFFVYVVDRDSAWQHKVVLGAPLKDKVIVKEGLSAGERIVVDGLQKLRNATPVQVGPPAAQAPMAPAGK